MSIVLGNQLSNVAAQTTLDLQGIVTSMRSSGMTDSAISATLMSDLTTGGRIFGNYRNQVKNTVKSGVSMAGSNGSEGRFLDQGVKEFQWVTVSAKPCPDCERRLGETGTMEYWRTVGKPQSGFSVCQQSCQCQLIAADYKGENLDKPLVRGEKKSKWKPAMTLKEAERWNKNSIIRETYSHVTEYSYVRLIMKDGFNISGRKFGKTWGNGVYLSNNREVLNYYKKGFYGKGKEIQLKINVKKLLRWDMNVDTTQGYTMKNAILRKAGVNIEDYNKLTDSLKQRLGVSGADAEAFTRLLKAKGYDGLEIIQKAGEFNINIGGSQIVIFDPKNISVLRG